MWNSLLIITHQSYEIYLLLPGPGRRHALEGLAGERGDSVFYQK
jgi:hypothetical protein